ELFRRFRRFRHALTLAASGRDKGRELAETIGAPAKRLERLIRGLTKLQRELARALNPAERHERGLLGIRAGGFARFDRIAFHVKKVVDDLEGKSEVLCICGQ